VVTLLGGKYEWESMFGLGFWEVLSGDGGGGGGDEERLSLVLAIFMSLIEG